MNELTKKERKEITTALRTMGEKSEKLLDKINAKGKHITAGESWIMDNFVDLEFYEVDTVLEKREDSEILQSLENFGMSAEQMYPAIDGDHEFPHGRTALNIIDNFLKVAKKYADRLES